VRGLRGRLSLVTASRESHPPPTWLRGAERWLHIKARGRMQPVGEVKTVKAAVLVLTMVVSAAVSGGAHEMIDAGVDDRLWRVARSRDPNGTRVTPAHV
jgi:hypothetical protein